MVVELPLVELDSNSAGAERSGYCATMPDRQLADGRVHSGLTLAALMMGHHFSISAF
jgi:hypothetical protein